MPRQFNLEFRITANELKTKGVALLDQATAQGPEALIWVRGKTRYVLLPMGTDKCAPTMFCSLLNTLYSIKDTNQVQIGEHHDRRITYPV